MCPGFHLPGQKEEDGRGSATCGPQLSQQAGLPSSKATHEGGDQTTKPKRAWALKLGRKAGQIGLVARCRVLALALTSFEPF